MDAYIVYCKINGDRITVGGAVFTAGNDCPLTARLSIAVLATASQRQNRSLLQSARRRFRTGIHASGRESAAS